MSPPPYPGGVSHLHPVSGGARALSVHRLAAAQKPLAALALFTRAPHPADDGFAVGLFFPPPLTLPHAARARELLVKLKAANFKPI